MQHTNCDETVLGSYHASTGCPLRTQQTSYTTSISYHGLTLRSGPLHFNGMFMTEPSLWCNQEGPRSFWMWNANGMHNRHPVMCLWRSVGGSSPMGLATQQRGTSPNAPPDCLIPPPLMSSLPYQIEP